jgi:hypothetical protein
MRDHDYYMQNIYPYRTVNRERDESHRNAERYREQWLALRSRMRQFFRDNQDIDVPADIRKAIGLK